jgi:anti-sigma factor RsiW
VTDQPCNEFVELVTDYLEDALTPDHRAEVDEHLTICDGCRTVLAQWHEVIRLTGHLADPDVDQVDPATRTHLLSAFRSRGGPPAG